MKNIWDCKIGECPPEAVPSGGDMPMRKAVAKAYLELTGQECDFIFSGWGGSLTEGERSVVEDREPDPSKVMTAASPNASAARIEELEGFIDELEDRLLELAPEAMGKDSDEAGSWEVRCELLSRIQLFKRPASVALAAEQASAARIEELERENGELRKWLTLALGVIKSAKVMWLAIDKAEAALKEASNAE